MIGFYCKGKYTFCIYLDMSMRSDHYNICTFCFSKFQPTSLTSLLSVR